MKSIKEYILDAIQESYIFEMAYDRKEIKKQCYREGLIKTKAKDEEEKEYANSRLIRENILGWKIFERRCGR